MSGILYGLKSLVFNKMNDDLDLAGTLKYDVGVNLLLGRKVAIKPNVSTANAYGDNVLAETETTVDSIDVTLERTKSTASEEAMLLGRVNHPSGGYVTKDINNAPYGALSYVRTMTGGIDRYVCLYKVKFQENDDNGDTKEDKNNYQYPSITGLAIPRYTDKAIKFTIDSNDPAFTTGIKDNWGKPAFLETVIGAATQTFASPAEIKFVTELPTTGVAGVIYVDTDASPIKAYYWNGTAFVEAKVAA